MWNYSVKHFVKHQSVLKDRKAELQYHSQGLTAAKLKSKTRCGEKNILVDRKKIKNKLKK